MYDPPPPLINPLSDIKLIDNKRIKEKYHENKTANAK